MNKDLLYNSGNYTQYFVISCKENESEKNIYIYIYILYSLPLRFIPGY